MPWKSKAEQKWGHSPAGLKALGGPDAVAEFDAATDFSSLPDKAAGVLSKTLAARRKKPVDGVLGKRIPKWMKA